eukprot:6676898-Pyramimonas_sp.AAC.1
MGSKLERRHTMLRVLDERHPEKGCPQRFPVWGVPNMGAVKQCGVLLIRGTLKRDVLEATIFEGIPNTSTAKQCGAMLIRHPKQGCPQRMDNL